MNHSSLTAKNFWGFSLEIYQDKTVQHACLTAQDEHGADVNLLLLGAWLNALNHPISLSAYQALMEASHRWQKDKLEPIRKRRRSQDKGSAEYKSLLAEELHLEQQEQEALITALHSAEAANGHKVYLFNHYCQQLNIPVALSRVILDATKD